MTFSDSLRMVCTFAEAYICARTDSIHCSKNFLVLASCWKITFQRMEETAVNTGAFFPPRTEFFRFPHGGKVWTLERDPRSRSLDRVLTVN
jgi:hypothetical protein